MVTDKKVELQNNSKVYMSITVSGEAIEKEYQEIVKKYCQTVDIKGFRKGKVPPDILKRKFSDSLISETAGHVLETALQESLESVEYKPLPYGTPEIKAEEKMEPGKDYTFEVYFDTYPEFKLAEYKVSEVEKLESDIGEEEMERELKALQEQNSFITEKKGDKVEDGDVVTIDYVEVDIKNKEIENTKREGFVFQIGSGYNLYNIDDDLVGMKKDEGKTLEKKYPYDYENKSLAGKDVRIKVKIKC